MSGILRGADLNVEIHDDHFAQDAPDEQWLMVAGQAGLSLRVMNAFVTALLRQAIHRAKVRMFVVVAHGHLRIESVADIFLKALPKVRSITASQEPPFIAKIWREGSVEVIGT
jgi:hypothetical protein